MTWLRSSLKNPNKSVVKPLTNQQRNGPVVLKEFAAQIEKLDLFDSVEIFHVIKAVQAKTGIKGRQLWMPIRIAVTHEMHGPELPESIELVGRETALEHIHQTLAQLEG